MRSEDRQRVRAERDLTKALHFRKGMFAESIPSPREADRVRGALLGTLIGEALADSPGSRSTGPPDLELRDPRVGRAARAMIVLSESLLRCDDIAEDDLRRSLGKRFGMHQPRTEATGPVAAWVAPVAVRFTHDCVLLDARARNAARLLDDRALDVDCALVQAAAVGAAVLDDDPLQAAMAVAQSRELRRRLPRVAPGSGVDHEPLAHSTAEAVARGVVASASGDSFAAAIEQALEDGDAGPTLGALTGASAGARFGASGIPARWINALEDAPDGSRHISALADELQRRAHAAPSRMYRVPRRHRSSA